MLRLTRLGAVAVALGISTRVFAAIPPLEDPATSFPVTLGTYSTTLIGSLPSRTDNIRLAAAALDGTILEQGEALSFNRVVGERTAERGYQPAPVILHESSDVQTGGGICQVASTLFNAALLAGLDASRRYRHSYPVDYVPLGQDATIVWGAKDLEIVNGVEQRVRLRVDVLGTTLTVRVEGEEPPIDEFELATVEGQSQTGAEDGSRGRIVELYRVHFVDGEVTERVLIHRDVYPPTLPRATGP